MITVFFARYAYINPGWPTFLEQIQKRPPTGIRAIDVTTCTRSDLERYAAESSTIVIDQSIENASTWAIASKFSIYRIEGNRSPAFYQEIAEWLWDLDVRRVFLSNFDLHDDRVLPLIQRIQSKLSALVWMFEKRPRELQDIPIAYRDPWLGVEATATTTWEAVRRLVPIRIELPFALAEEEFASGPSLAWWDTCVPGAPYATRALARQSMLAAGMRLAPAHTVGKMSRGISRAMGQVLPPHAATHAAIALQRRTQWSIVRASGTCFVCGSGVAYPTRKFFEVSGLNVPMVAYPCVGFEDYGFRSGLNALAVEPEEAGSAARWLRSNRSASTRLASESQKLMARHHRVSVRVTQFLHCLRRLERDALRGAEFVDGEFVIA